MKKFRRALAIVLIIAIALCFINAKTDFFLNIGTYIPTLEENAPDFTRSVSDISEQISMLTDYIPSIAEITAMIKQEEPPIDPSDVAMNAYIENSPMLTFFPRENIGMVVDYSTIQVFGTVASREKAHLIADFTDENGESLDQISFSADSSGAFNKVMDIPDSQSYTLNLSIYTGSKEYGQFESWIYHYITLERTPDGGWQLMPSPVFEHNREMFEKDKSISEALKPTISIQSNNDSIISIAEQLTDGIDNDYDKILALHDWVCSYLYYDIDSLDAEDTPPYYATDVVREGKAVCLGFATLMAALCRAIDIPCNVVAGYALGVGEDMVWTDETVVTDTQNHAWNEIYVDGRWMIVDTTWDCTNKIRDGVMEQGSAVSHTYFDANLQFFSANHKILEYLKRR